MNEPGEKNLPSFDQRPEPDPATATSVRATCRVCPHTCSLAPGAIGACRARKNVDGQVVPAAYGRVTALAVDPVEKKPLARWQSGSTVLSLGGYGCNLRCPWCQNHEISQVGEDDVAWRELAPTDVAQLAARLHSEDPHMVGVAYTYNEPLVTWEYVRDCAQLVHDEGLANVLVSAGCVSAGVVREIAPLIDAANIDLKTMRVQTYRQLGGDLAQVQETIRLLSAEPTCHLELTCLIVPGINDSEAEMNDLASWVASLDEKIVLHVTRFFPNWHMRDRGPTPVATIYRLAEIARHYLPYVYTGNC